MITKKFIVDTINLEYKKWLYTQSVPVIPLSNIVIKKMRPFGMVNRSGVMYINSSYIGTELFDEVIDTIKHELAHLIVGFAAKHGPKWKACCRILGCRPVATAPITDDSYMRNNFNYMLVAKLTCGTEVDVKSYIRKSKTYINAAPGSYKLNGKQVQKFYYRDI